MQSRITMNPISLGNLRPLVAGGPSLNPGGAPRGKRIATWMSEYGQSPVSDWPVVGSAAFDKLPGNARIALRRLRAADQEEELGLANSKYVEPTAQEAGPGLGDGQGLLAGIALAIMAMKAAGVLDQEPAPAHIETQKVEEDF